MQVPLQVVWWRKVLLHTVRTMQQNLLSENIPGRNECVSVLSGVLLCAFALVYALAHIPITRNSHKTHKTAPGRMRGRVK
eukprot:scaffold142169_cov30-Tisochrysis_lutea.AAC.1